MIWRMRSVLFIRDTSAGFAECKSDARGELAKCCECRVRKACAVISSVRGWTAVSGNRQVARAARAGLGGETPPRQPAGRRRYGLRRLSPLRGWTADGGCPHMGR